MSRPIPKRLLVHQATLFNYTGESEGKATYAVTVLNDVRIETARGVSYDGEGNRPLDQFTLFIDAVNSYASDEKNYVEPKDFTGENGWTLNDKGNDLFIMGETSVNINEAGVSALRDAHEVFQVQAVKKLYGSTSSLHHFEVRGGGFLR